MQWSRRSVALVALLAMLPVGSIALATCGPDAANSCCCAGDCPDRTVRISPAMPCCKPAPAAPPVQDVPAQRVAPVGFDAFDVTPIERPAASEMRECVSTTGVQASGVRHVPLFRLHESLLI